MKLRFASLFLIVFLLSTSCATILDGRKNTINVSTTQGGIAQVYLDGKLLGEAPMKIRVSKYSLQEGSIIEVKKDDYKTLRYEVVRRPHVGYVLLNVVTGAIPLIVDVATGNIYRPNTRQIEYDLVPLKTEAVQNKTQTKNSKN